MVSTDFDGQRVWIGLVDARPNSEEMLFQWLSGETVSNSIQRGFVVTRWYSFSEIAFLLEMRYSTSYLHKDY